MSKKHMCVFQARVLLIAAAGLMTAGIAQGQQEASAVEMTPDVVTASTVTSSRYHLFLTKQARAAGISAESSNVKLKAPAHPVAAPPTLPSPPAGSFFYPDDVQKVVSTGKTISSSAHHPVYINCPTTSTPTACYGGPATFLTNLDASSMIHISDQYTGSTTNGRYSVGTQFNATATIYPGTSGVPTLGENDLLGIVHSAAKTAGTGYGHIYHLFLPKGVDTCMDEGPCYSPDNQSTFVFCGYHYAVKFSDLASPVYYTVIPYQGAVASPAVNDCTLTFSSPNGALVDSMATVLLHETFETITDPDITTGYRGLNNPGLPEVGDICEGFIFTVGLNGHNYDVQSIYSDKYEACATTP
ncbi:MAG TPA: hypothetical protein VKV39_18455 [Candidatus Sulfotelmatobacter sp.]|nr:hypothetical protein [Candidatus Sulfotelmatobacter sp.]